jgi:membrane-bound metal-dependent hydrolase YbcI (DUF457 family)
MIKSKKALSSDGHAIFSTGLLIIALYIIKNFIEISILKLFFSLPFYLFGTFAPDVLETPSYKHRHFFHSRFLLLLILFLFIPITVYLCIRENEFWILAIAFLLGYASHLLGDSLTSTLPKI